MQDENVPVLSPDFLNTKLYDPKGYTQVPDDVLPLQATATRFPVPEDEKYLYPCRSKTLGSSKASAAASPSRSKTTVKVEPSASAGPSYVHSLNLILIRILADALFSRRKTISQINELSEDELYSDNGEDYEPQASKKRRRNDGSSEAKPVRSFPFLRI